MEPREIGLIVLGIGILAIIVIACIWLYRIGQRRKDSLKNTKLSPEAQKAADKIGSGWTTKKKDGYTKVSDYDIEQGKPGEKVDGKSVKAEKLTVHDVAHILYFFLAPFVFVGRLVTGN